MRKLIAFAVVAAGAAAFITIPAAAKPPTGNGRIVFTRFDPVQGDDFVYTANPDGSQEQQRLGLIPVLFLHCCRCVLFRFPSFR